MCKCDHQNIEVCAQTIFKARVFVDHTLQYIQGRLTFQVATIEKTERSQ